MRKYQVLAKQWSDEAQAQVMVNIGEFDSHMNANLFAEAYSKYYHATVEIDAVKTESKCVSMRVWKD